MFFLFILMVLIFLALAIYTLKLRVEIHNLIIDTEQPQGQKINKDNKVFIKLLILGKLVILKRDSKNIKFRNKNMDIKLLEKNDIKIDYTELLENVKFEQLDLKIQVGTKDAALTAILTGIIGAGLGIILRKPKYEIIPIYSNKNLLKIKIDCIFSIHLTQYIYKVISNKMKDLGKRNLNKKVEV